MRIYHSKRRDFIEDVLHSDTDECILWPFAVRKSNGYGAHSESSTGKKKNHEAHNFVCKLAHGEPEHGEESAHICGHKLCVNPKHLRWATPFENMEDAKRHGTLIGGGRYRQRIFESQRVEIEASKESLVTIGKRFGIEPAYAGKIRRKAA